MELDPIDIQALEMERDVLGETELTMTNRLFRQNAPAAAATIVQLATRSNSERIRLAASQYVVERVMGRIQDNPPVRDSDDDPYAQLLKDCLATAGSDGANPSPLS